MRMTRRSRRVAIVVGATAALAVGSTVPAPAMPTIEGFVGSLGHNTTVASTVPANGDVNPYGVAVVPESHHKLVEGDILVSNFNNAPTAAAPTGEQGTGRTIVEISPGGQQSLFATPPPRRPWVADHRTGRAAVGLGDRRQPAHHRRHFGHDVAR